MINSSQSLYSMIFLVKIVEFIFDTKLYLIFLLELSDAFISLIVLDFEQISDLIKLTKFDLFHAFLKFFGVLIAVSSFVSSVEY